ncbi:hypothetical protein AgCh_019388 [Apium graveolens]
MSNGVENTIVMLIARVKSLYMAICRDPELLRVLGAHLRALDPEELARAVAEVNASQQGDGFEGAHIDNHDDEFGGSS